MFDFAILAGMVFFVRLVLVDSESSDMVDWSLEGIVRSSEGIVRSLEGIVVGSSEGIVRSLEGIVVGSSEGIAVWSSEGIVRSLEGIVIGPSNGIAVWSSEGIAVETYNAPIPMDTASIAMMAVFLFIL